MVTLCCNRRIYGDFILCWLVLEVDRRVEWLVFAAVTLRSRLTEIKNEE